MRKEIDLREKFDEIVLGKNGNIPHGYKVLIRSARKDSSGNYIK